MFQRDEMPLPMCKDLLAEKISEISVGDFALEHQLWVNKESRLIHP
jgi:hypothetical protein